MLSKKIVSIQVIPALGPYSQATVYGNIVFTSGQIAINSTGQIIGETIEKQAKLALENLKKVLESAGSEMDKVLKCTIFLKDMDDFNKVNVIYAQYFKENFPARSCVEIARLSKGLLIEIEAIAHI